MPAPWPVRRPTSVTMDDPPLPRVLPSGDLNRRWRPGSVALVVLLWLVLHIGSLFSPGLLDDVDSVYLEVAREMLTRHDFVTPYVDGIRFFDKPPLMYWLAAGSMRVFGIHDWAGRLPLALLTLALLLTTYALGVSLFPAASPLGHADRAGLYAALALGTSIGPYLYTRFFLPDVALALWLALAVLFWLVALERASPQAADPHGGSSSPLPPRSTLWPMLGFTVSLALNSLTKGLVGVVLTLAIALAYTAVQSQLRLLRRLHLPVATLVFVLVAAPWHILAALRNPSIPMPSGVGLPARAGWAWFYLYNEHIARFLSRRIPHDYGQVPIPLFWFLALVWLFPWIAFLPAAVRWHPRRVRDRLASQTHDATGALLVWAGAVLLFFTASARQEYYSLPALPALALLVAALLARADLADAATTRRAVLRCSLFLLVPVGLAAAILAGYFVLSSPTPAPNTDIVTLLAQASNNPADYNLSLSHLADLSAVSMGFFRIPLAVLTLSMLALGPGSHLIRRSGRTFAANLVLTAAAAGMLLAIHGGLTRFYPTLGSKALALAVVQQQYRSPRPDDLLLIDGELTSGSSLLFYTQQPAHLVNGRMNGTWFGAFWPDAPPIFETDASLQRLWSGSGRLFLLTAHPNTRTAELARFAPVRTLATAGGKSVLTNR